MAGDQARVADARFARLIEVLHSLQAEHGEMALAYSGGLDSRFLAHAALLAGLDPILLHVAGPHVPARESALAQDWAATRGVRLHTLSCDPLAVPEVRANGKERCYFCKRDLFTRLAAAALEATETRPICLCDGSNHSDLDAYRPGLRALQELGIVSPLAEAKLDKSTIRELAALSGLERPDQPSRPCLLTRLNYGVEPTPAVLALLDKVEAALEIFLPRAHGSIPDFRVRFVEPGKERETSGSFALHISEALTQGEQEALAAFLMERGLPIPELLVDHKISGYFDRRA